MCNIYLIYLNLLIFVLIIISSCSNNYDKTIDTEKEKVMIENSLDLIDTINHLDFQTKIPNNFYEDTVHHYSYSFSYSEKYEQPRWLNYTLTREMLSIHLVKRKDNFREDPFVVTRSAQLVDYKSSGYDRGHLCPAKSMEFSEFAMSESFYMSNMSPQHPSLNRGIWKKLETKERKWAVELDSLEIYCGGVFDSIIEFIGPNNVAVPSAYYKIIFCPYDLEKSISFIFPNEKCQNPLSYYVVPIDSIEEKTKLDFFSELSDNQQDLFESRVNISNWIF